jgi:hypothetical protein
MLNRIKNRILHVLRNYCGYYELKKSLNQKLNDKQNFIGVQGNTVQDLVLQNDKLKYELDKLSDKHEAKILEYDILFAKNETNILERDILDAQVKDFPNDYKKYLVLELEQILNIMKEKGIHPQDLIKRMVNKLQIDINNK